MSDFSEKNNCIQEDICLNLSLNINKTRNVEVITSKYLFYKFLLHTDFLGIREDDFAKIKQNPVI